MPFLKAETVLSQVVKRSAAQEALKAVRIRAIWQDCLLQVAAKSGFSVDPKKVKAVSYRMGVLTVVVPSAVWGTQLRLYSRALIRSVNDALGAKAVEKIRVKISP